MLVLINCNFDGDTYALFNKVDQAKDAFKASVESGWNHKVLLVKPNEIGEDFGFGSRGDVFGAEIIEEWNSDDDEDSDPTYCVICGGDASICDGC